MGAEKGAGDCFDKVVPVCEAACVMTKSIKALEYAISEAADLKGSQLHGSQL